MKVLIIGATGTIGKAIATALDPQRHEIIKAGAKSGDVQVDISNEESIKAFFTTVGKVDAVISAAGHLVFKPLQEMTTEDYLFGLQHKLMGQINLARLAIPYLNNGGAITLTSGILSEEAIIGGTSAAMVNAGIDSFVKSAAIDLPRSIRINVVSPTILTESMPDQAEFFRGFKSVPASDVALAYIKSLEGKQTGQIYQVY